MSDPARRIAQYLALVETRPEAFANPDPAGIVILLDSADILVAEEAIKQRYRVAGHPLDWAECGIYYEDPWLVLVRDVVRFPDGGLGTYHHIVLREGSDGVIVLPIIDGEVVLIRHFRNGARDWSWEVPRGGPKAGRPEDNAREEIEEEIGAKVRTISRLGAVRNNNGMITETMHVYMAELSTLGESNLSEGIDQMKRVSPSTLAEMIRSGAIDDCHTAHAFLLARLNGLL